MASVTQEARENVRVSASMPRAVRWSGCAHSQTCMARCLLASRIPMASPDGR